ncbi:hypothetical protein [Mycetohabitans sp. B46]|uniref:hypothetical protein n=1 Tax=Mycetohabitans sp. B46 TaxID=2772536 RepID=UPI00307DBD75
MSVKVQTVCGIALWSIGAAAAAGWLDSGYHSAGAVARASRPERVERSAYLPEPLTPPVPRGDLRSDIQSNAWRLAPICTFRTRGNLRAPPLSDTMP